MAQCDLDVIIFGATGYTGEHVARTLHKMKADGTWPGVRWAVAGRSEAKLRAMCEKRGLTPTDVLVADVQDAASLRAMAARGDTLLNCTGPYRFYGEPVVEACVATGCDYLDLCGEPEFIDRCQLRFGDSAAAAGALVVHACAFDSVPADIGTLYAAIQFAPPALCAHAELFHIVERSPGVSGAAGHATTFQAAVHGFSAVAETRAQRRELVAKLEAARPGSSRPPPKHSVSWHRVAYHSIA